ncbi:uncharacterized protein LOC122034492 [Zingiber officinale]|uniref:Uncharacterized protein n=1 Tax=Zingiber officinale TaxID=94328 RepID=A0A8J5ET49_ZINOF|nr:uncharacterized protein LOC122034492 [Zingiber officinale]KAG6469514.1 hypothetical protein ZIOFF_074238 [Zingiber officinale]
MASKPVKVEELIAKKLALWHTRTFRPIMTHEELEPLLAAAGFVPLPLPPPPPDGQKQPPAVVWREYASRLEAAAEGGGRGKRRRHAAVVPRPRLPHPRIDGLHLMTYKAFFLALEFYLGPTLVPNLFHVRTMSLTRAHDRVFERSYRPMRDCEMDDEGILVYRDGTLDQVTRIVCSQHGGDEIDDDDDSNRGTDASRISSSADNSTKKTKCDDGLKNAVNASSCLVPLKDLFPTGGLSSRRDVS